LEHLLSSWNEINERLNSARHILLLTDYDGTLTPIVARPELAVLPPEIKLILRALAEQSHFTLGVISGRALEDLKERVGIPGIIYAGNHGLEIEGPGIKFVNPVAEELRPVLRVMHYILGRSLKTIKGVFVENKGLSLTVHYRQAEERRAGEVESVVRDVIGGSEALGKARLTHGKKVYEVRPDIAWDKGKAVKLLMKRYGKGGRNSGLVPIYLGDDLTDEDAFKAIEGYGQGLSVLIGESNTPSHARFFLKSPAEVAVFLKMLLAGGRRGFKLLSRRVDIPPRYSHKLIMERTTVRISG
jgi:trehalose-phosphatase